MMAEVPTGLVEGSRDPPHDWVKQRLREVPNRIWSGVRHGVRPEDIGLRVLPGLEDRI